MSNETSLSLDECKRALEKAGVPPAAALAAYMYELLTWNEMINVTGAKSPEEFAVKHVADVWRAFQAIGSVSDFVADIGSGGGLPGIPLAILSPNTKVTLVERRQKKSKVIASIVSKLDLDSRVRVLARSFEEVKGLPKETEFWFRGFLPGPKLAVYLSEFFPRADLGRIILMKGPAWPEEKLEIMNTAKVKQDWVERFGSAAEVPYELPHGAGQRLLVIV